MKFIVRKVQLVCARVRTYLCVCVSVQKRECVRMYTKLRASIRMSMVALWVGLPGIGPPNFVFGPLSLLAYSVFCRPYFWPTQFCI